MYRVEVRLKSHLPDARGQGLVKDIADLGIDTVSRARVVDIYWLDTDISPEQVELICSRLLADQVTQVYWYGRSFREEEDAGEGLRVIEVTHNPGVIDPIAASILKAIADLGITAVKGVKTAKRYYMWGQIDNDTLESISGRLLVNPIIQHVVTEPEFGFPENPEYVFSLETLDILGDDAGAVEARYGFSADEFAAIQAYYRRQGRRATDIELETLVQTWSEHCGHKTFRGLINYNGQKINNLLKSTIMKATTELAKPWCLSVFLDNAGVIDFDGQWALCFKVETHNHPSAIEPYGGAATGIGGVIRDPLGTGLGAKPILNTDVFCFGPPDLAYDKVPPGVLHPRRIFKGVRSGVADYANRMGIPTLNGAVLFDERYVANPLVYCGTLGLMPKDMAQQGQQQPGDLVVLVGGRTGRDGIHGVTFASEQLTESSTESSLSSVQIGNPIVEKKLLDVLLQARDRGLYRRITDCGGGGLSSAVGEMGETTGVRVDLEKVPLKYAGLSHTEIWVSEAQERMIVAVPPEHLGKLSALCSSEDVEMTVIGVFTDDKKLSLHYDGHGVGSLDMEFLHEGWPQVERQAVWVAPVHEEPVFSEPDDLGQALLALLGTWNICSKEWVIRQYDHEVQGANVLKPLVGIDSDGPGDAAIIRPILDSDRGVIVANGIRPAYADIDPYWMAASAIDEALRQIIAVGGSLERVALLDNFCWGNTNRPEMLGSLVRAAQACHDMALAYGTPFISGKDSLNNEFQYEGNIIAIPDTLLISSVAVMEDVNRAVTMDLKAPGNLIYILGATHNELGGSEYYRGMGYTGNRVPRVHAESARQMMQRLSAATGEGLVAACHDLSEGGLGVALAEMAFAGGLGADVDICRVLLGEPGLREDFVLFSESNSRFLVEVAPGKQKRFEEIMADGDYSVIGNVTKSRRLKVAGAGGLRISLDLSELKEAWQRPLRW